MGGLAVARALMAVGTAAALAFGLPAGAHADETVVVRGTAFPDAGARLAYVGCSDLLAPDAGTTPQVLQPYIGRGPARAPEGARSLGYDLAGGTAVGSQHVVSSMLGTTTASLSVFAREGARGLAVAGYQEPADAGTHLIWFGTAPLTAPAGTWHTVDATPLSYTWTKYDMSTRAPVPGQLAGGAQPVAAFAAAHGGDGAGLYAITFGCDGAPFSMDAMRIGSPGSVTTYDIEGLATSLSISGSATRITAGEEVTFRGALRSSSGGRVPSATVILERRATADAPWEIVRVVPAGDDDPVARLTPAQSAVYRWRFVDRPLAEGAVSPTFLLLVGEEATPPPANPQPLPEPTSTPEPPPMPPPLPTLPPPPSEPATQEAEPQTPSATGSSGASDTAASDQPDATLSAPTDPTGTP